MTPLQRDKYLAGLDPPRVVRHSADLTVCIRLREPVGRTGFSSRQRPKQFPERHC
jgi:hypothetical protein